MVLNTKSFSIDTIKDVYVSPDVRISFDSEISVVPETLQREFDKTVAAWAKQRRKDWRKQMSVSVTPDAVDLWEGLA